VEGAYPNAGGAVPLEDPLRHAPSGNSRASTRTERVIGALGGGTDGPVPESTESVIGSLTLWYAGRAA